MPNVWLMASNYKVRLMMLTGLAALNQVLPTFQHVHMNAQGFRYTLCSSGSDDACFAYAEFRKNSVKTKRIHFFMPCMKLSTKRLPLQVCLLHHSYKNQWCSQNFQFYLLIFSFTVNEKDTNKKLLYPSPIYFY